MSLSGLLAAHSHARTSLTDLSYSVRKEIARGEEIVDRVQETRLTPEREPEPVCSCVRVCVCTRASHHANISAEIANAAL
jgi:hypothetical protein